MIKYTLFALSVVTILTSGTAEASYDPSAEAIKRSMQSAQEDEEFRRAIAASEAMQVNPVVTTTLDNQGLSAEELAQIAKLGAVHDLEDKDFLAALETSKATAHMYEKGKEELGNDSADDLYDQQETQAPAVAEAPAVQGMVEVLPEPKAKPVAEQVDQKFLTEIVAQLESTRQELDEAKVTIKSQADTIKQLEAQIQDFRRRLLAQAPKNQ